MSDVVERAKVAIASGHVSVGLVEELLQKVESLHAIVDGVNRWMDDNGPRLAEVGASKRWHSNRR